MLNDISLSLFVGLAAGAYSSIFIATPLVADLKEREPAMKSLKKRVLAKRAQGTATGETRETPVTGEDHGDESEDAAPAVVGPRDQSATRARGRGPSFREAPMTGIRELLLSRIRDVADYPEPGVMFKDITPLLADPAAFAALSDVLADIARATGATKVVGLEARGFILARPGRRPRGVSASSPCARRASSPEPPSARPTTWSTAPPRSRCTRRT
ncbi:hypothetical protein GCM10023238_27780 [Streptomyces heliomycini]